MTNRPTSETDAYELLERLRWGGPPRSCPHCAATGRSYFLRPTQTGSRPTRTGATTERRVWKCGACRRQFSVLVGTILQGTRLSLQTWVAVMRDWSAPAGPPTARQIADRYAVSPEAARQLRRRIELALTFAPAPIEHAGPPAADS
jgi:transposase-like protein